MIVLAQRGAQKIAKHWKGTAVDLAFVQNVGTLFMSIILMNNVNFFRQGLIKQSLPEANFVA
jgi:hypothetical protein